MTRRPPCPALLLAAALVAAAGCGRAPGPRPPEATNAVAAAWTPDRIARDPDGYLEYAGGQIELQIREREQRLARLERQRAELKQRESGVAASVEDVQNLQTRLATAIRRADDEDRWPLKFAGQSFSRERAQATLAAIERYVTDRGPLAGAYTDAFRRFESTTRSLQADLARLARLKEKIALDVERIRLNQGMAELADLRKVEEEISVFSRTLAESTDDPLAEAVLQRQGETKAASDFLAPPRPDEGSTP